MSDEKINLYAEFISKQLGSDSVNESNSAKARHDMSAKVKKYESEPVSKGEDHEIKFTGGDDNDMHYHGHVNGKKFTATSTYVGDNDDQDEETKRVKDDLSDGLKAHGISGDDHKKALKAIMKHARKEIHDTYHP
jgi:hypothetical protein